MKNDETTILSKQIREMFANDKEFNEALNDALILEKLKTPTNRSIQVEDLEEEMIKLINNKNKFAFQILLANYKRYLYKHILELERDKDK